MKMDVEQFDVSHYLSVLPLFSDLSPLERERLVQGCQLQRLSRGDMVFRVGEECDAFHVAVVGKVKLYVASPSGHEKVM